MEASASWNSHCAPVFMRISHRKALVSPRTKIRPSRILISDHRHTATNMWAGDVVRHQALRMPMSSVKSLAVDNLSPRSGPTASVASLKKGPDFGRHITKLNHHLGSFYHGQFGWTAATIPTAICGILVYQLVKMALRERDKGPESL